MTFPKHIKCVPNDRKAVAPYNFVELPEKIVEAAPLPSGDHYYLERHTGRIESTLTTSSPLYIRCGLTPKEFEKGKEAKDLPDFFYTNTQNHLPVIPGSSLRGMLRNLIEIIGFGKLDKVADSQLIYRAVGDTTSLGDRYRERLLEKLKGNEYSFLMRAGYMIQTASGWSIRPAQPLVKDVFFSRIEENDIPNGLKSWHGLRNAYAIAVEVDPVNTFPHNSGNVKLCYSKAQAVEGVEQNGVLIKTGWAPRKHMQFIFGLPKSDNVSDIPISNEMIQGYREQITDGQEKILGKDAGLQNWQPVFYILEADQLVFFGHAMMFRLPYKDSVRKFIPSYLKSPDKFTDLNTVDLAEAIFGYVREQKSDDGQSHCGRLFVTNASCTSLDQNIWWTDDSEKVMTPQILGGPKPTTFQHYLTQPEDTQAKKKQLKHYASTPLEETVIRGHKLYWHKGSSPSIDLKNPEKVSDSQKTQIKPIKSGVSFKFSIYFENLTSIELGALLWVLDIAQDDKYRLSLGMGKPLGMGAVKITHHLYLSKRQERYESLFAEQKWCTGYVDRPDIPERYVTEFDKYICHQIGTTEASLKEVRRIKMLLAMLSWDEAPSSNQTRYMEIECNPQKTRCLAQPRNGKKTANEYAERPVLPTPLQVIGWEKCNDGDTYNSGGPGGGDNRKPDPPKIKSKERSSSKKIDKSSPSREGSAPGKPAALERPSPRPKSPKK
jgi:CRISPR-associated protein (TIGR03986 family)